MYVDSCGSGALPPHGLDELCTDAALPECDEVMGLRSIDRLARPLTATTRSRARSQLAGKCTCRHAAMDASVPMGYCNRLRVSSLRAWRRGDVTRLVCTARTCDPKSVSRGAPSCLQRLYTCTLDPCDDGSDDGVHLRSDNAACADERLRDERSGFTGTPHDTCSSGRCVEGVAPASHPTFSYDCVVLTVTEARRCSVSPTRRPRAQLRVGATVEGGCREYTTL